MCGRRNIRPRTWRKVTAALEGLFKTVAYDARGWGKSDKTSAGYIMADLTDEALSLVKALGIKQYVLVGHSMGGKVAQLVASRRPEGLLGLILVAPAQPTPRVNPDEMREGQVHAYDNGFRCGSTRKPPTERERAPQCRERTHLQAEQLADHVQIFLLERSSPSLLRMFRPQLPLFPPPSQ
jgi:pimeloyl-ACP methyl ester carboxylesterase